MAFISAKLSCKFSPILLSTSTYFVFCLLFFFFLLLFLFSYLGCNAVVVFLYFHSKIVFGCWPTFSFYEGDKYCLLYAMLLFSVLEKSNREYIQHFFQLIWTEMFLLQIPFRMWHQANSASGINWTLHTVIGSRFPVQTCTNLIL